MAIQQVKCRAEVNVGGITVVTPYVQSFNVRRQRGQVSTFDASLKIPSGTAGNLAGGDVVIRAGEGRASNIIFTGVCRSAKVSPCFDDPHYVILSVSGADKLSLLQGKKFTRRCRSSISSWASITGLVRAGLKSGKFAYNTESRFKIDDGNMQIEDPTTGARPMNAINGVGPGPPPSGENEASVTVKVQIWNEDLGQGAP
jgi:hypothetical protein